MDDLWTKIDDELEAQALAILGAYGDDLAIVEAASDDVFDLDRLDKAGRLPFVLIRDEDTEEAGGGHGDGMIHVDVSYPYSMIAIAKIHGKREARKASKELRRRLLAFIRNMTVYRSLLALRGHDGESVQRIRFQSSGATLYGRADRDQGMYFAVAGIRFVIDAAV